MINGVPTVTVPVNTPANFKATSTAGTADPDPYWTVKSGPTYLWQDYEVETPPNYPTTTLIKTYSAPGTVTMRMACQVAYVVQYIRGATAGIQQIGSQDVTINVIGGPVSGDNNIYWFCDSSSSGDWGHLSAASGQPAGTTYSWSLTGTGAQFVGGTTSATATYCGAGAGSKNPGDVKATVTYSLNGVSTTSDPFPITVHAPASFVLNTPSTDAYTKYEGPGPDDVWGFTGEHLYFTIKDGLGQTMRSSQHQAYWTEKWELEGQGNGPIPDQIGGPLDDAGSSTDTFKRYPVPQPTNANGDKTVGPITHSYNVTDQGGGFAGPGVGCSVQVYSNVTYNTFGVVGNGLPVPTK